MPVVEEESRDNDGQEEAEVIEETGRDDDVEQAQEQTTNDENDADELVFRHYVHCLYKRLGTLYLRHTSVGYLLP